MSYSPTLGRWTSADPMGYVDGLSLYQYVKANPVNRLDPSGLKSQPCTLNGQPLTLTFDGTTLSASSGESWSAVSGRPTSVTYRLDQQGGNMVSRGTTTYTFDYSAARRQLRNIGPIPEGTYSIETCEQRYWSTSPWSHIFLGNAWGAYSWSMHPEPGTQTFGRSGFFVHGGAVPGSAGCIDLTNNDTALAKLLDKAKKEMTDKGKGCCCSIQIVVKYPKDPQPVTVQVEDVTLGGP